MYFVILLFQACYIYTNIIFIFHNIFYVYINIFLYIVYMISIYFHIFTYHICIFYFYIFYFLFSFQEILFFLAFLIFLRVSSNRLYFVQKLKKENKSKNLYPLHHLTNEERLEAWIYQEHKVRMEIFMMSQTEEQHCVRTKKMLLIQLCSF